MKNITIYCNFINFDLFVDKYEIELYVNEIPTSYKPQNVLRFVYLIEPPEILDLRFPAIKMQNITYDYLLTHDEFLLNNVKNSYLTEFGSCWVKDFEAPQKKEYSVSFLCGGKLLALGHVIRHEVWSKSETIETIPKRFFLSKNFRGNLQNPFNYPTLVNDKRELFNSQFHICIENTNRKNWFTEKLIDCLYTRTVPIYWGCPNINEWFDTRGFILANSAEDAIKKIQNITDKTYEKMLPYVESNYLSCLRFVDINEHVKNKILEIIKK